MRIIGGEHKGRRIQVLKSLKARPTTDFARENLFNVLHNHFEFSSLQVLDLFSGTGSISFEFYSRGCRTIDLVELNSRHYFFIKDVVQKLQFNEIIPIRSDAFRYIQKCTKSYGLIFADPPYDLPKLPELPDAIFSNKNILQEGGWFILEHSKNNQFKSHPYYAETRHYGSVNFSIFKKI